MSFRFRKSIGIIPGVRLNIGKDGITSVRVGGRYGGTTIGKKGVRQTISAPGTGLSYSEHTPWEAKPKRRRPVAPMQEQSSLEDDVATTIQQIRDAQASAKERLDKLEAFERQMATDTSIDYKASCQELLEFAKGVSNGYVEMCDNAIALAEITKIPFQEQQPVTSRQADSAKGYSSTVKFGFVLLVVIAMFAWLLH